MIKDLIKVMNEGTTRQQEFDALSPEEKKKELANYKPFFERAIPSNIMTDINSGGIIDVILASNEVGFDYKNGSEDLIKFLYKNLISQESDLDNIGMTSSIKNNFFLPLVRADFKVNKALKEIDKIQSGDFDEVYEPDSKGRPVKKLYRVGWSSTNQKQILTNVIKSVTTLLLIRYVRKFGIDANLKKLGVEESVVKSRKKYCAKFNTLKESSESKNIIAEVDNLFIEKEEKVISKLKNVTCDKWPGKKKTDEIKGLYRQSEEILKILKIKLSKSIEGRAKEPFSISDLSKIKSDDMIIVESYGVLAPYIKKLNNPKVMIQNAKGSIIFKLQDIVDTIASHCRAMDTFLNNRNDLGKESYNHLMNILDNDYKKINPSWIKSAKSKQIVPIDDIVEETYNAYLRHKKICIWLNKVFNYRCITDADPFKKEYIC